MIGTLNEQLFDSVDDCGKNLLLFEEFVGEDHLWVFEMLENSSG